MLVCTVVYIACVFCQEQDGQKDSSVPGAGVCIFYFLEILVIGGVFSLLPA